MMPVEHARMVDREPPIEEPESDQEPIEEPAFPRDPGPAEDPGRQPVETPDR